MIQTNFAAGINHRPSPIFKGTVKVETRGEDTVEFQTTEKEDKLIKRVVDSMTNHGDIAVEISQPQAEDFFALINALRPEAKASRKEILSVDPRHSMTNFHDRYVEYWGTKKDRCSDGKQVITVKFNGK